MAEKKDSDKGKTTKKNAKEEDATIIDEKQNSSESNSQSQSNSGTAEPEKTNTDEGPEGEIKFNFRSNDFAKKVMEQRAADPPPTDEPKTDAGNGNQNTGAPGISDADKEAYLRGDFDQPHQEMSLDDLMDASEMIIDLVDAINSMALQAWTKEPSERFQLPSTQRKKLATSLAKVFYKYQAKMGPLIALIIGLLLYFGLMWKTGFEIKKNKEIEAAREAQKNKEEQERRKSEMLQNRILATMGHDRITMKDLAIRMGQKEEALVYTIEKMLNKGSIKSDHREGIIKYQLAA